MALFKPKQVPVYEFRLSTGQEPRATEEANLFELDGGLAWPPLHNMDELLDPNYQKVSYPLKKNEINYVMTFRCKDLKDFTEDQLSGLPMVSFFLRDFGIWPDRAPLVVLEYKRMVVEKLLHRHTRIHLYDSDPAILKALESDRVIPHLVACIKDPFVGELAYSA